MRGLMLLGVLVFLGCGEERVTVEVAPRIDLLCQPCCGDGEAMALNTTLPVPIADIVNHDLCFSGDGMSCWYSCPGSIEESVFRGDEVCQ
jgi:hypothetical protein